MKHLSPQEKKRLSYERDRRNCYGESPHGARTSIPRQKALRNRANRRSQNHPLEAITGTTTPEFVEEVESRIKHRAPRRWTKSPDAPLGSVVAGKLEDREVMRARGGRRAAMRVGDGD